MMLDQKVVIVTGAGPGMGGYRIALLFRVPRVGISRSVVSVAIYRALSRAWMSSAARMCEMC